MRLATTTNTIVNDRTTKAYTSPGESIRRCVSAGFRVFDMSLMDFRNEHYILRNSDWESQIFEVAECASELKAEFSQAHAPYWSAPFDVRSGTKEELELFDISMTRAIKACAILGVKWVAFHAVTDVANNCEKGLSFSLNLDYFGKYIDLAKKLGVGIAFENTVDIDNPLIIRRYHASYEELCEFADSFHDGCVGVCWDFGHANRQHYKNQSAALKFIGKRLKALHVNDNHTIQDTHNIPFLGTVEWEPVMKTLTEIGYGGDFSFEIKGHVNNVPEPLKDKAIKYAYDVGSYVLSLAKL
ncbi:MAG: sugar phosphate isomerase/epimerase [Bacteroidota bacterium]|nr:sugar phosphate isomerase/epimerase [Bacteroidota bacterium]